MGVPVIRVIPDNTIFYDPFHWEKYPLKPVNSALEIKKQLVLIEGIRYNTVFYEIAEEVLKAYFTKPTEENMKLFIIEH